MVWFQSMHQDLCKALREGSLDTVKVFLDIMEGDVNTATFGGQTTISYAAEAGQVEITEYLLSRGADWSIRDNRGLTAVYWAAREARLDAAELLVKAGASVSAKDVEIATSMKRQATVDCLREHLPS